MPGLFSLAVCLWLASQSTGIPDPPIGLPTGLGTEVPASRPPTPPDEGARHFAVSFSVETGLERQRIKDSHDNFGAGRAVLERSLTVRGTNTDAFADGVYSSPLLGEESTIIFRAGLGAEQLGSHFNIGNDNVVLGDPAGRTVQDFSYGLALAWEAGAELRYRPGGGPVQMALTVDYRGGGDDEKDALTENHYHYWRLRGGLLAAWRASETFRPYVGVRYTYYRARFELKDFTNNQDFTLDLVRMLPVDITVGLELFGGPVVGGLEISFLGTLGVVASVAVPF